MKNPLPVGKLSPEIMKAIIGKQPVSDPRVKLGPGIGLDCAVIDQGEKYLILKTDPITFATEEIGWYAVQIITNDIATTGAIPRWLLVTTLLPENLTDQTLAFSIADQLFNACRQMDISLVNGHTEVTHGLDRPIIMCAAVGEVEREHLVTPLGASPGNDVLITKSIPVEGTALLAREFSGRLKSILSETELEEAKAYTHVPGIGVFTDARTALTSGGKVTAMHDPTEGGLASALWELSEACGHSIQIDSASIPVTKLSAKIMRAFSLNPLNTIASGSLLLTADHDDSSLIIPALNAKGIPCTKIGTVLESADACVMDLKTNGLLPRPEQDDIARVFS